MNLRLATMVIETDVYVWTCKCGSSFSIVNHFGEDFAHWGNPERPPFCPSCGEQLPESDGVER